MQSCIIENSRLVGLVHIQVVHLFGRCAIFVPIFRGFFAHIKIAESVIGLSAEGTKGTTKDDEATPS